MDRIVVVGASLAGLWACESLRGGGYEGAITLIGAEAHHPYDRPPLSKAVLKGEMEPERILLRKPDELGKLHLDLRLGVPAESLDVANRTVTLRSGESIAADGIVIATGSAPRPLPGQPDLDGVTMLRTLDDSLALRRRLEAQPHVVVIGAGFIGLEVAAAAAHSGCTVTVLEGAPAPLMRGLGAEMGEIVARVHARHGVDVRCGVQVAAIEGDAGRVTGVRLGNGELVFADVVVVGIGVAPATEWLIGSGLEIRDGIVCDDSLRAARGIFAAGDCARWVNNLFGESGEEMRVEHWTNAAEQGSAAAKNLLAELSGGEPVPYAPVPFFWSDQFDSRIQFVGRAHGDDEVRVILGDIDERFVAMYGHGGRLRGVLGVGMPKPVMRMRKLISDRASWETAVTYAADLAQ
ncbi:MAG TPA: FAD-dependent oxidoreductase [Ilumatobacteraceae bacterium]|jgi:NADPH-dependent 2,4-dienoyl-CoA reductase/sulfur reductase-like enzyme|nr:FAD-dependent oxidoreductase [Ilumatobacteraceae bacterium]